MKTVRVAAAVLRDGDRIFATQRGYGPFRGGWEFPGGKIEPGETPEEAAVRELKEEFGVQIALGEEIERVEYDYPDFHLSMDCFWAGIVSGEPVMTVHEDVRWLAKNEMNSVDWLPADLDLIEKIKELM